LTSIHRKEWVEQRLQELAEAFAIAIGGFSGLCKDSRWEAICFWSIYTGRLFREGKDTISRASLPLA